MAYVMPEIALQIVIQTGVKELRADEPAFRRMFAQFNCPDLQSDYGTEYIDQMWEWFSETKIPTIQAWSFDMSRVPAFSVHLAGENEDESKAAMGDFYGFGDDADIGVNVFNVMLDVGIHASKNSDQVLWMYYMLNYILFKQKDLARRLGIQLQTFSASDYSLDSKYYADNVYTRWIRFRCTVQNAWIDTEAQTFDDLELDLEYIEKQQED